MKFNKLNDRKINPLLSPSTRCCISETRVEYLVKDLDEKLGSMIHLLLLIGLERTVG
jgi:hypothetical protein